jgi:hypothetical protein
MKHDPDQWQILAAAQQRHDDRRRVEHPGHRQVDAAADDDEGLAERDDADEGRQHNSRAHVGDRQETRREQRRDQKQHDHAGIGKHDQPVAGEEGVHWTRPLAAFSARELASTESSRMTPDATGCQ